MLETLDYTIHIGSTRFYVSMFEKGDRLGQCSFEKDCCLLVAVTDVSTASAAVTLRVK